MKRALVLLAVLVMAGMFFVHTTQAGSAKSGGIYYESRPDEVALYLSDVAFVRDTVVLPTTQDTSVLLPPGTYTNTLILTENGARVHHYRISPQTDGVYSGIAYVLSWETEAQGDTREVTLEYLMSGGSWSANYDMTILSDTSVRLAFNAEIYNTGLTLEDTTVYLVAGRVDLSQQVDQVSQVTMNQYMVGYDENTSVNLPALGVGSVDLQYIYPVGTLTAEPGDTLYVNLVDSDFVARRLVVWNATTDQETDVIYKVTNNSELPWAEGVVRIYQDDLFMGSDFVETTPITSEGSITAGSLPDVRVRRTESQEYKSDVTRDYYQHNVALEVTNHGTEEITLIVFDTWNNDAWEFVFSDEPQREQDNILRWEITLAPGEARTITYQFRIDY
jgi:hypothetical protein